MTVQHLQPETTVARDCQNLWQERKTLENKSAMQQASTDFSDDFPSAASTSFESNTESILQPENPESSERNKFLEIPRNSSNAEAKRQKYKNLLQSRSLKKKEANSFESVGSDSTSGNRFGSSFDSVELSRTPDSGRHERHR